MSRLFTLAAPATYREEIRKSRFVAHAAPVSDAGQALAFFASRSDPAATHNCWAYRIGAAYRFNDDGEPGGTAGRPILQAIDGQSCDRVAVLVVRWFGGILLGAGGLMRAYGGCAASCLRLADKLPVVDTVAARFECPFADLRLLKSRLGEFGAIVTGEDFGAAGVAVRLELPREHAGALAQALAGLSRGRIALEVSD
ncbi:IMPACT family protein [Pigmentiphaga soli]|uniref:IMPACT family protein n=1 Tax=Pigmentiphaga soli TaxID=1007095 RepID=A0ABP8H788_9BURK